MKKIKSIDESNYSVELFSDIKKNEKNKYTETYFIRTTANGKTVESDAFKSFSDAHMAFDMIVERSQVN